jgi:hypothetical protein
VFTPSSDGKHEFNSYMFPTAGSWTVTLHDASDNTQAATLAVTVS